ERGVDERLDARDLATSIRAVFRHGAPSCRHGSYNRGMTFHASALTGDKPEQYAQLLDQARALMHGERDLIANAANLSALLWHGLPRLNWCGFYLFDGTELVVGPFQGLPACVRIPLGKGVCGTAATTRATQVVEDVDAFPGHIACDSASRSECVVPLFAADGALIGVLDLDSPEPSRFDAEDAAGLESIAAAFVESVSMEAVSMEAGA